ncbi:MAG: hypothetical protein QG608_873 [Actinomycetota bacterium]|nr:hypothetical protein [Actinomycetota bacterium]
MSEQPSAVEWEPRPTEPLHVPEPPRRRSGRPPRLRTVLLGLVGLGVAVSILMSEFTDVDVDTQLVVLTALIGSGAVLLLCGIGAAVREARAAVGRPNP